MDISFWLKYKLYFGLPMMSSKRVIWEKISILCLRAINLETVPAFRYFDLKIETQIGAQIRKTHSIFQTHFDYRKLKIEMQIDMK